VPFPSPPWSLRADAWASVFALARPPSGRPDRPAGAYVAAFVDYREGGVLQYHELLVARLLRDGPVPRIRIVDIWVDSPESLAGGRSLWAIPKELAHLALEERRVGPVRRASFRTGLDRFDHRNMAINRTGDRLAVARGEFTTTPRAALVRLPFRASTSQVREDGSTVVTSMSGSGRAVPCHARWTFDPDGPLGYLSGRRPLVSASLRDVRLRFG
jgi:acetoacetate decarboxylase